MAKYSETAFSTGVQCFLQAACIEIYRYVHHEDCSRLKSKCMKHALANSKFQHDVGSFTLNFISNFATPN